MSQALGFNNCATFVNSNRLPDKVFFRKLNSPFYQNMQVFYTTFQGDPRIACTLRFNNQCYLCYQVALCIASFASV